MNRRNFIKIFSAVVTAIGGVRFLASTPAKNHGKSIITKLNYGFRDRDVYESEWTIPRNQRAYCKIFSYNKMLNNGKYVFESLVIPEKKFKAYTPEKLNRVYEIKKRQALKRLYITVQKYS